MRFSATSLTLIVLFLSGCVGRTIDKTQVNRIKLGMSVIEVEEILGKGKVVDAAEVERLVKSSLEPADAPPGAKPPKVEIDFSELRGIRWGSDKKSATVIFRNERVFRVFSQGL